MRTRLLMTEDRLLYRRIFSLKASQLHRFRIRFLPPEHPCGNLWVKVRNREPLALRAAYIAGPYVLYVDCKPEGYHHNTKCFISADQPVFEPQLLPGQSFYAELSTHTLKDEYCWEVDVVSQIIFNNSIDIDFEITVGTSKEVLHKAASPENKIPNSDRLGLFEDNSVLSVASQDTLDIWNLPVPNPEKPIHLVILTHGLHSNVSSDMLYLKEQIDKLGLENIVVKGYFGNICKTERGIKYLGSRVAEYVVDVVKLLRNVTKISFIAHSLGGLVQTFSIAYLQNNFPWFFEQIQPINFITLSSPMLGVVNDNPVYVKLALYAGIVGRTGQDLGLKFVEKDGQPLLLLLPTGLTHQILRRFVRRTVYANVMNDGIVPLRTSALMFLDYKGLSQLVNEAGAKDTDPASNKIPNKDNTGFSLPLPFQTALSYFMPQKQKLQEPEVEYDHSHDIPKIGVLETATSLILPPLPSMKYITDPESRDNVILHDKVYTEEDLPPRKERRLTSPSGLLPQRVVTSLNLDKDLDVVEEEIAREYHKNMTWRKVLVKLKPDAHNNIIVRRRFANAYGWPVIDHLVSNHFSSDEVEAPVQLVSSDSLDQQLDLSALLSREAIAKQNEKIDEEEPDKHAWINAKEEESFFSVGPTGLLSDVGEILGHFRNQWNSYNESREAVSNPDEKLMQEFA